MFIREKHIWILESDPKYNSLYEELLSLRYYIRLFHTLADFKSALLALREEANEARYNKDDPSLIISEIKLPDGFFLHFLGDPQHKDLVPFPFMIVTSLDDLDALRFAFKEGAWDYFIKPFHRNELIVKIELRLQNSPAIGKMLLGHPYFISPSSVALENYHSCSLNFSSSVMPVPSPKNLTIKEYEILILFYRAQGKPVQREEILTKIWKDIQVHPKTVDVHLFNLRRKMRPLGVSFKSHGPGHWIMIESSLNSKNKASPLSINQ